MDHDSISFIASAEGATFDQCNVYQHGLVDHYWSQFLQVKHPEQCVLRIQCSLPFDTDYHS